MAIRRRSLWLDFVRSVRGSMGRFLSIVGLMALGSFALVGLSVTGPDMRATGMAYFSAHNAADLMVYGDFGLDEGDCALIERAGGVRDLEYGYLKDVVIRGTSESVRVQSSPERVSTYEVVEGRLPETDGEIALDVFRQGVYEVGDVVSFDEKADAQGSTVLRSDSFVVVGFVSSSEIISRVNKGSSTAGSGELAGYAVVVPEAFDSDVYMTARLTFDDTAGLDPYGDEYADAVHAHRDELAELLDGQPGVRLSELRAEGQERIDEAQAEVDEGQAELDSAEARLADARAELDDAAERLEAGQAELADRLASAQGELDDAAAQLAEGRRRLESSEAQIAAGEAELADSRSEIEAGTVTLEKSRAELADRRAAYEEQAARRPELEDALAQVLDAAASLEGARGQVALLPDELLSAPLVAGVARAWLAGAFPEPPAEGDLSHELYARALSLVDGLASLSPDTPGDEVRVEVGAALGEAAEALDTARGELEAALAVLDAAPAELADAERQIEKGEATLREAAARADAAEVTLASAREEVARGRAELEARERDYEAAVAQVASERASATAELAAARDELMAGEASYQEALEDFELALPDAERRLAEAEGEIALARERLDRLEAPGYSESTRRELPGGTGYKIYATVSEIVDSLARVFPVLLYFIAALVTFTTMTRMVEESRIETGTLKALGYTDAEVSLKFVCYGLASSMLGTALGVLAGHTILPLIVYNAYASKFVLPHIVLEAHLPISLAAVALGLVSAVLPAWMAARQELRACAAELMVAKPPASGSKIMLERFPAVWNRLDFMRKVTARNLFRYKKRMFMTVFGVAGAVVLLVAGFGTQYSISGISAEQFGAIVTYDMIVARSSSATDDEVAELEEALVAPEVSRHTPVRYEEVTRVAGANGDTQEITLLVPEDPDELSAYIDLRERVSGDAIALDAGSCVLSERLSQLIGVGVGDTFAVTDSTGEGVELTCTGVCEMYMGHFLFLGEDAYREAFGREGSANACLVTLADSSEDSVNSFAAELMGLPAVRGVVQNTSLIAQIATIVESLNKIMVVLIVVATLLAAVILYNLTTINVSERIRELSTIKVLGFYDGEVTLYVYRETALLTAIGVLVGYALGVWFRNYVITVVPPDNVMFDPSFAAYVFVVPLVVVGAITVALGFVVNRRLRDVDMLEALKSMD